MAFWHPVAAVDGNALRLLAGPLLVGYALLLGASNVGVGILSALGPATQILQLPTVALIERWRMRKAICWWAALVARTPLRLREGETGDRLRDLVA